MGQPNCQILTSMWTVFLRGDCPDLDITTNSRHCHKQSKQDCNCISGILDRPVGSHFGTDIVLLKNLQFNITHFYWSLYDLEGQFSCSCVLCMGRYLAVMLQS